ncbi:hypothetical protein [Rubellimicrobium aerolatum]|uniref:Uncharacterized protein n=1 Tax=Rubellimicrobium aerolatum TaxID=490979 RepID=A0ABW0SC52_9RHOB|nr:hypothetical protein [Rubellimicrobium aerolatum]MBP1805990.1 hypothetical protein [Rubellimicrobium aerolatum]
MSLLLNVLLSLAFAGAVGGTLQFWRAQLDAARRDAMQALAARRGWALTETGERLGRAGTLRLAPRGGHPWTVEVRPKDGPLGEAVTEFETEEPRWTGGTLIVLAHPGELPALEPVRRERALRDLLGRKVGRLSLGLAPVAAPSGVAALADADPARRVDLPDLARAMAAWRPAMNGPRGIPVLILTPEGMRLRLRHPLDRAEPMEAFADLALDLARLIGPG